MRTGKDFDVIILGGGPAGASTAITLARSGLKVAVLERSCYDSVRVGETLPPEIKEFLARLNLWDVFRNDGHYASPGILASWGSQQLYHNDFILNPYGNGWHIARSRFDRMLVSASEEAGVCVYRGARVTACTEERSGEWLLKVNAEGEHSTFSSKFVVEATGRSRSPVIKPALQRTAFDKLNGCAYANIFPGF